MNNDQKIKLLASGDYFLYAHIIDNSWYFVLDQKVRCDMKSVVVHKNDKTIADAVMANHDVRMIVQDGRVPYIEKGSKFFDNYNETTFYQLKPQKQIKQICDNPDVNAIYISNMNDLNNLPIPSDELTLKEILQDVQEKKISVDASELLIKARFKISEG